MFSARYAVLTLLSMTLLAPQSLKAEPVPVRQAEGLVHGFLVLRDLDGTTLADGDLIQTSQGTRVTTRLLFQFKDGSVHDETAVYTQRQQFLLQTYHLIQKGPTFKRPVDMLIDARNGRVTVQYADDDGKPKSAGEQMDLPPDLANGLVLTLLKNVKPESPPKSLSYVAATPSPRLIKLELSVAGRERFSLGSKGREATHYVLKPDIGGISGLLAPLVGKQPPDSHVWILQGEAPAFVKSEQSLFLGGPIWRIELVSPSWPRPRTTQ
ncbi:MAG TPA: hypothetical protein VMS40_01520 [Vicinamibacterales bacterium]|nr:hypothetical protein [Vicinamibacterales bacterium]